MDLARKRVLLIGCGNMGAALAQGWQALELSGLSVFDIDAPKAAALAKETGTRAAVSLAKGLAEADIAVLAIKPQGLSQFLTDSAGLFRDGQLLISILAGTPIRKIRDGIAARVDIVRAMPNTPALVDEGFTALCGGGPESLDAAERLFDCVGEVITVEESMMDAVTAVSGSGPAYVFHFVEGLVEAARAQGFSDEDALAVVLQTVRGALTLLEETGEAPEALRKKVTSPGGTTQAALEVLQRLDFKAALSEAVAAAVRRSKELGQ
ncbi:MAG: pyrroline-5-carboxylate reductase [Fibrobacterota bacterium]